jgi:predicted GNAT superfamily acetyltransferase
VSTQTSGVDARVADRARRTAAEVAERAGVRIGPVEDVAGVVEAERFLAGVWHTPAESPPLPADVLRSLCHAGGAVLGARAGGELVGAAVAVFEPPATRAVYSLIAGAATSDRGIGLALKQAQRAWALERGATAMTWTFDPLVSRNARFNLVKLGARAVNYVIDFYGPMADGINAGDETDRLTVRWDLLAEPSAGVDGVAGPGEDRAGAEPTAVAPDGGPLAARTGQLRFCRVPRDIVALRAEDPAAALAWRRAVRGVLTEAFDDGYVGTAMSRDGWYRLERSPA